MIDVLMLVPAEADAADAEAFVSGVVPSLKAAAGASHVRSSRGELMSRGSRPPFDGVIEATFDSLPSWMAWAQSPERAAGREVMERLRPLVLFFEVEEA